LTVPQVRRLLKTVLPLKRFSTAEMIAYVQEIQQRNYRAYRSHRKRGGSTRRQNRSWQNFQEKTGV